MERSQPFFYRAVFALSWWKINNGFGNLEWLILYLDSAFHTVSLISIQGAIQEPNIHSSPSECSLCWDIQSVFRKRCDAFDSYSFVAGTTWIYSSITLWSYPASRAEKFRQVLTGTSVKELYCVTKLFCFCKNQRQTVRNTNPRQALQGLRICLAWAKSKIQCSYIAAVTWFF